MDLIDLSSLDKETFYNKLAEVCKRYNVQPFKKKHKSKEVPKNICIVIDGSTLTFVFDRSNVEVKE